MNIGISTASFFTKEVTEDTFEVIKELGIETVEVFLTTFREYLPEFGSLLKERARGLEVYSIHTLNQQFEPELFNPTPRTREDSESFLKQAAAVGGGLGAKYYTFHGPARLKKRPYVFNFEKLGRRVDELDALLEEYGKGIRLSYENVHWAYFSTPDFFASLKKHCNIKACLDIKQAMQGGNISVYEFIDAIGDRLVNVHLCDYDKEGNLTVPGRGIFDFTKLFSTLLDKGYDGPLMMELYADNYQTYDDIKIGYEYLQSCLDKAKRSY